MNLVYLDFETASRAAIKKVGAANYLDDESTFPLCLAVAVNDQKPWLIKRTDGKPDHSVNGLALMELAGNPENIFVAHNVGFDYRAYKLAFSDNDQLNFPPLPLERWKCTMAKAYSYGLPGNLKEAAKAMHLDCQKDMEGRDSMLKLSKPKRNGEFYQYEDDPEAFEKMYAYCLQDIEAMRELDKALPDLPAKERRIWLIDMHMNQRGVQLDLPLINKIHAIVSYNKEDLKYDFWEHCDFNPSQRDSFKPWFEAKLGKKIKDTTKETLDKLKPELTPELKTVVEIFLSANKTSLAKYNAMTNRSTPEGVMREYSQYHGGHTGRFAGRGVQFQNLPRPHSSIELIAGSIMDGTFDELYGDINQALSSCIRGAIIARPGHRFLVGDFKQMEQRVTAWLAGEQEALEAARRGIDPYCKSASGFYGREITKEDKDERQAGKISELALGFQGGIGSFAKFADTYKVDLLGLYHMLRETFDSDEVEFAEWDYNMYLQRCKASKSEPIGRKEGMVSSIIKQRWRANNPAIVELWDKMEIAAVTAVESPKLSFAVEGAHGVRWFMHKQFLMCKLPSGRNFAYPFPKVHYKKNGAPVLSYKRIDPLKHKWIRHSTYGGQLTENIVQATQRDLLTDAMLRLDREGYTIVLHVHDEIVCEQEPDWNLNFFTAIMEQVPKWAGDLPIGVDSYEARRYDKR